MVLCPGCHRYEVVDHPTHCCQRCQRVPRAHDPACKRTPSAYRRNLQQERLSNGSAGSSNEASLDMTNELAKLDERLNQRLEDRRQVMAANGTLNIDDTIRNLQELRDELRRFNACYDGWGLMWRTGKPSETSIRSMLDQELSGAHTQLPDGAVKPVWSGAPSESARYRNGTYKVPDHLVAEMEARGTQPFSFAVNQCRLCGYTTPIGQSRWSQCPNCGIPASWH